MKATHLSAPFSVPFGELTGAPVEFRILRAGMNDTEKGDFLFDDEAATSVMEAYAAKGLNKVQIDYEHQSMRPPPAGGDASKPAAGWFKPEVRNGELWATGCAWTSKAMSMLAPAAGAPEYRYFSPILFFDEESRRVTRIKNLALTNDPAMDEIEGLVAASNQKEIAMPCENCTSLAAQVKDMQEKCSALSAKLSAFEEKDKEKGAAMTSLTGVRDKIVALTGQATEAAALGVIDAWKTKAARTDVLETERAAEQAAALTTQIKIILDKASEDGKLAPALRPFEEKAALAFGGGKPSKEGLEFLTAKWGAATAVVSTKSVEGSQPGAVALSAEDYAVAEEMGTNLEEFEKFKVEQLKKKARQRAAQ